jgi:hypothetical protein
MAARRSMDESRGVVRCESYPCGAGASQVKTL